MRHHRANHRAEEQCHLQRAAGRVYAEENDGPGQQHDHEDKRNERIHQRWFADRLNRVVLAGHNCR